MAKKIAVRKPPITPKKKASSKSKPATKTTPKNKKNTIKSSKNKDIANPKIMDANLAGMPPGQSHPQQSNNNDDQISATFPEIEGTDILQADQDKIKELITPSKPPTPKSKKGKERSKNVVIFYHQNILQIYKQRWIIKCWETIANQTMQDFDIIELNYGDPVNPENGPLIAIPGKTIHFYAEKMKNHCFAMNFCLDKAFNELDYEVVFNINMDDYYDVTRFEKQLKYLSQGYDLVSSDFCYIEEVPNTEDDRVTLHLNILKHGDIKTNLDKNHNMIAHPCVAYAKSFWDSGLRYQDLKPAEDMDLWKRAVAKGLKLAIVPEELLFYRRHSNQICK